MKWILIIIFSLIIFVLTYKATTEAESAAFYTSLVAVISFLGNYIIEEISKKDKNVTLVKEVIQSIFLTIIKIIGIISVLVCIYLVGSNIFIGDGGKTKPTDEEIGTSSEANTSESDLEKDNVLIIENNKITGKFSKEGEEECFEYVPRVSGIYRFDFESNDVKTNYKFNICTENQNMIISSEYSSKGKNVELNAGEKYIIKVKQYSGFPEYEINIGVPNEICEVEGNNIEGTLLYEGEEDKYTYIAPVTGQYRFNFASDNDQSNYKFYLYTENNEKLAGQYYSDNGKTLDLDKGETYTIVIAQYSGYASYKVTIGVPNLPKRIEGNNFSGSLLYIDQKDCYTYVAPKNGRYRFDFMSDNDRNNYKFYLYAENNEKLVWQYYSDDGKTIDLEADKEYRIEVIQYSGFENYTINIGVPNDISNIVGDVVLGNFTYKDQENVYTYRAAASGKYKFTFETNDVNTNYKFYIISSINEKLVSTDYWSKNKSIQLEAGQLYTIKVIQYSGFPEYQIKIQLEEQ